MNGRREEHRRSDDDGEPFASPGKVSTRRERKDRSGGDGQSEVGGDAQRRDAMRAVCRTEEQSGRPRHSAVLLEEPPEIHPGSDDGHPVGGP